MDNYETPEVTYLSAQTLSSVQATGSGGGSSGGSTGGWFAEGTINNPCDLTDIGSKTVTASEYYFKCEVAGAVDFSIEASGVLSEFKIYNTVISLPNLLEEYTNISNKNITISNFMINTGSITYLVYVKASKSVNITCTIKQHIDIGKSPNNRVWEADLNSGRPNPSILCQAYWYLDIQAVYILNGMIVYEDFINLHTDLFNNVITVFSFVGGIFPNPIGIILSIAGTLASIISPFEDKEDFLKKMWSAAGYQGLDCDGKPIFTSGVRLGKYAQSQMASCTPTGVSYYEFVSWDGQNVSGCEGYTGEWREFDFENIEDPPVLPLEP